MFLFPKFVVLVLVTNSELWVMFVAKPRFRPSNMHCWGPKCLLCDVFQIFHPITVVANHCKFQVWKVKHSFGNLKMQYCKTQANRYTVFQCNDCGARVRVSYGAKVPDEEIRTGIEALCEFFGVAFDPTSLGQY
jgi:hypothetical protein